jgi:hypothetical protein
MNCEKAATSRTGYDGHLGGVEPNGSAQRLREMTLPAARRLSPVACLSGFISSSDWS